jgi:hypothetical protein
MDELYFDRQGKPMTQDEWVAKWRDMEYRRIAEDKILGVGWVSTVWLGLDHGPPGRPMIFETIFFPQTLAQQLAEVVNGGFGYTLGEAMVERRYATEVEALEGHVKLVKELRRKAS